MNAPNTDASTASLLVLVAVTVAVWLATGVRHRFRGWRWWEVTSFLTGSAGVVAAVLTPLDDLGHQGVLAAHVGQHIILGDGAAPLLMLGLPPEAKGWLRRRTASLSEAHRRPARLLAGLLSPVGAVVVWSLAAYAWYSPPLHRVAVAPGLVHTADQLSFLGFGMLIWLGAFDPRAPQSLRRGLRDGGLPWWSRHAYAMGSRVAMIPAAAVLWKAPGYYGTGQPPPGYTSGGDQVAAASLLIGFEMLLFTLAFVLAFIFLTLSEGRRLAAEDAVRRRTTS